MSDQTAQPEQNTNFAGFTIPPPEDEAAPHQASAQPTMPPEAHPDTHPTAPPSQRRGRSPEGATRPASTGATHSHAPLDDALALASILAAPLDPARALGDALLIGLRMLGEARSLTVYALDSTSGQLLQLATVEQSSSSEPPLLDLERRSIATLGMGPEAEHDVLHERRRVAVGADEALPLRRVTPDAPGLAGVLVVRWNVGAQRGGTTQKVLLLLTSSCAVLLDRREQSLAHDAFLSLTVHELRSPLTAVKGYAQLLLRQARRLGVPPQTRQAVDAIEEQASRMADMISEMHDAVRIRRGDLELQLEATDIRPLVAHAVQQQRRLFPQHEIALEQPAEPLVAEIDPQRLTQVVAALVNNAARYSPAGGPIAVRVARRESELASGAGATQALVCVQDAGIGVATADRAPIFEYLYRAPEAKRRHLSGLGLGLFVGRSLVEHMRGRLWLEQTGIAAGATAGEQSSARAGSTFCFAVPLLSAAEATSNTDTSNTDR